MQMGLAAGMAAAAGLPMPSININDAFMFRQQPVQAFNATTAQTHMQSYSGNTTHHVNVNSMPLVPMSGHPATAAAAGPMNAMMMNAQSASVMASSPTSRSQPFTPQLPYTMSMGQQGGMVGGVGGGGGMAQHPHHHVPAPLAGPSSRSPLATAIGSNARNNSDGVFLTDRHVGPHGPLAQSMQHPQSYNQLPHAPTHLSRSRPHTPLSPDLSSEGLSIAASRSPLHIRRESFTSPISPGGAVPGMMANSGTAAAAAAGGGGGGSVSRTRGNSPAAQCRSLPMKSRTIRGNQAHPYARPESALRHVDRYRDEHNCGGSEIHTPTSFASPAHDGMPGNPRVLAISTSASASAANSPLPSPPRQLVEGLTLAHSHSFTAGVGHVSVHHSRNGSNVIPMTAGMSMTINAPVIPASVQQQQQQAQQQRGQHCPSPMTTTIDSFAGLDLTKIDPQSLMALQELVSQQLERTRAAAAANNAANGTQHGTNGMDTGGQTNAQFDQNNMRHMQRQQQQQYPQQMQQHSSGQTRYSTPPMPSSVSVAAPTEPLSGGSPFPSSNSTSRSSSALSMHPNVPLPYQHQQYQQQQQPQQQHYLDGSTSSSSSLAERRAIVLQQLLGVQLHNGNGAGGGGGGAYGGSVNGGVGVGGVVGDGGVSGLAKGSMAEIEERLAHITDAQIDTLIKHLTLIKQTTMEQQQQQQVQQHQQQQFEQHQQQQQQQHQQQQQQQAQQGIQLPLRRTPSPSHPFPHQYAPVQAFPTNRQGHPGAQQMYPSNAQTSQMHQQTIMANMQASHQQQQQQQQHYIQHQQQQQQQRVVQHRQSPDQHRQSPDQYVAHSSRHQSPEPPPSRPQSNFKRSPTHTRSMSSSHSTPFGMGDSHGHVSLPSSPGAGPVDPSSNSEMVGTNEMNLLDDGMLLDAHMATSLPRKDDESHSMRMKGDRATPIGSFPHYSTLNDDLFNTGETVSVGLLPPRDHDPLTDSPPIRGMKVNYEGTDAANSNSNSNSNSSSSVSSSVAHTASSSISLPPSVMLSALSSAPDLSMTTPGGTNDAMLLASPGFMTSHHDTDHEQCHDSGGNGNGNGNGHVNVHGSSADYLHHPWPDHT